MSCVAAFAIKEWILHERKVGQIHAGALWRGPVIPGADTCRSGAGDSVLSAAEKPESERAVLFGGAGHADLGRISFFLQERAETLSGKSAFHGKGGRCAEPLPNEQNQIRPAKGL